MNTADPVAMALVRWLEDGNEALHRVDSKLASEPIGFLFRSPEGDRALVGAIGPGSDKVGRTFPLAIFAPTLARDLSSSFPLMPVLYRPFIGAAQTLIASAATMTPPQIAEQLRQLPLPGANDVVGAQSWARMAAGQLARQFQQRLFGEPPEGQQYYAFHTFQLACQPALGKDLGRAGLALDCPCSQDTDLWVWMELARRTLNWPAPPLAFWRDGATPELLLSLGNPPPTVLPRLSAKPRDSQKIWPLKTKVPAAITAARKGLSAAKVATLDDSNVTIEALVASLCRSP